MGAARRANEEVAMLSDRDRRTLRDIEESLERNDARTASTFALGPDRPSTAAEGRRYNRWLVLLAILTALLLMLGLFSVAIITSTMLGVAVLLRVHRSGRQSKSSSSR